MEDVIDKWRPTIFSPFHFVFPFWCLSQIVSEISFPKPHSAALTTCQRRLPHLLLLDFFLLCFPSSLNSKLRNMDEWAAEVKKEHPNKSWLIYDNPGSEIVTWLTMYSFWNTSDHKKTHYSFSNIIMYVILHWQTFSWKSFSD